MHRRTIQRSHLSREGRVAGKRGRETAESSSVNDRCIRWSTWSARVRIAAGHRWRRRRSIERARRGWRRRPLSPGPGARAPSPSVRPMGVRVRPPAPGGGEGRDGACVRPARSPRSPAGGVAQSRLGRHERTPAEPRGVRARIRGVSRPPDSMVAAHMEPARASPMSARAKDFSIDALISRRPCDSSNDGSDADTPGPPLLLDAGEYAWTTAVSGRYPPAAWFAGVKWGGPRGARAGPPVHGSSGRASSLT
ncbi:hypothetical protein MTO96_011828 [Rhipicephalus appendiculatus]